VSHAAGVARKVCHVAGCLHQADLPHVCAIRQSLCDRVDEVCCVLKLQSTCPVRISGLFLLCSTVPCACGVTLRNMAWQ
jgi:hypothetical protein